MGLFSRSNNTVANTTTQQYDQRQVYDAGGGIVGEGNVLDASTTYSADFSTRDNSVRAYDLSNRSVDASVRAYDMSNRSVDGSVRAYDLSDRSTSISTDGGAFDVVRRVADGIADIGRMQTSAAEKIALSSGSIGNSAFSLAERAQADAAGFNTSAMSRVFDLSQRSSAQAYQSSADALGFAKETFGDIVGLARSVVGQAGDQAATAATTASGAYQSAADTSTGNKTLVYAGFAVVAIAAIAFALKR